MAKMTNAMLEAALEAALADAAGARTELASLQLRLKNDYVERAEYRRVQGVLTSCQTWLAKYKKQAQSAANSDKPVSDRRAAMMEAKRIAMEEGRTVSV